MHKNPFVPAPSYNPQPPLPPGPPPQQSLQADYSAYWAAAAAQGQIQQPPVGTYANQWTAPQPAQQPRPPPEQSALYANYGYGGNQNFWQQQQQLRQQSYQPPPPVAQPPPPPPQAAYNPYQPQQPYQQQQQPYIPQAIPPPPHPAQVYQHPPQQLHTQPNPQYFPQQPRQHQNRQQHSSQHPAKRPRYEPLRNAHQNYHQAAQFQPAPAASMPPPMQQQHHANYGTSQPQIQSTNSNSQGRNNGPPGVNQMPLGGRGGAGGRGGRGKAGSINMNRGGGSGGRGGRGGMYGNNNRGGGHANQGGGSFRNHARGGFGNRDHSNRRGGSFNAGPYSNQQGSSFRGRYNRSGRHDGGAFTARDSNAASSKRDDLKRTTTDFKILGLEIQELNWTWGVLSLPSVKIECQVASIDATSVKTEAEDSLSPAGDDVLSANGTAASVKESLDSISPVFYPEVTSSVPDGNTSVDDTQSPASSLRLYFHTPVTSEDAAPIAHTSALPVVSSPVSLKKGKRKRADDECEDDTSEGVHHPEPSMDGDTMSVVCATSVDGAGRDSAAPSVSETVSEADWLMAAIGEDEGDGDASDVGDPDQDVHNEEESHVGNLMDVLDPADAKTFTAEDSHVPADGQVVPMGIENADIAINIPDRSSSATLPATSLPNEDLVSSSEIGSAGNQAVFDSSTEQNISDDSTSVPADNTLVSDSDLHTLIEEQSTDLAGSSDKQVIKNGSIPLQAAASFTSTISDGESQDTSYYDYSATLVNEDILGFIESATQSISNFEDSQDPSTTNVGSSVSSNRLAISYSAASRRIIINAEVVDFLKIFRKDRRVEIIVRVEKDAENQLKGIVVEALSESSKTYTPLVLSSEAYEADPTLPPFLKVPSASTITLLVHLDSGEPNIEAKWVKSGDIQEWLKSMFGRMFWAAGAVDGWEKKIEIVDPDPAPTISTVLDGWAANANVGSQTERQRFMRTHLAETDNVMEILLRLVRGERATPFSQSGSTVGLSQNSVPGPLLSAIGGSAHGAQQTHVSLAVLAFYRMAVEFAVKADGDKGRSEVEGRMGDIIRCLPSHLVHKSLDGMFKEWKADKKGGR